MRVAMRHHIEHAKYQYDRITVTGWLAGDTLQAQTDLWVEDARGHRLPCLVERAEREDVAVALFGAEAVVARKPAEVTTVGQEITGTDVHDVEAFRYGFRIRFDAGEGERYVLCLSDGKRTVRCKTDAAQIRKLGRIPDDFKERMKLKLGKGEPTMTPLRKANRQNEIAAGRYMDVNDLANHTVKLSCVIPAYNTEPEHLADMLASIRQQTYPNWEICIADGSPCSMLERFRIVSAGGQDPAISVDVVDPRCGEEAQAQRNKAQAALPQLTVPLAQTLVEYLTDPRVKYTHLSENLGISGNTNAALALAEGEFVVMVDHDDVLEDDALEMAADVIRRHPQADFIYTDSDLTDHDNLYDYNPLLKPRWSQEMLYSANYITHLSIVRTELLRRIGGWDKAYDGAQDWDLFLRIGEATEEIYHIPEVLYHWRAAASSTARDVGTKPYARLAQLRAVQDHLDRRGVPGRAAFVDEQSTCIRVVWDPAYLASIDPDTVRIVTAPGVELSEESAAELRAWALQSGMGVIGPRVIGSDGRIASQGITLEIGANMPCVGMWPGTASFGGHTDWYQDHVAPDPLCWAISRDLWEQLGGLDESWGELAVMDLCLRAQKAGYRCMVTPFAQVSNQGQGDSQRASQSNDQNNSQNNCQNNSQNNGLCLTQRYIPDMVSDHSKLYKTYYPMIEDRPN